MSEREYILAKGCGFTQQLTRLTEVKEEEPRALVVVEKERGGGKPPHLVTGTRGA